MDFRPEILEGRLAPLLPGRLFWSGGGKLWQGCEDDTKQKQVGRNVAEYSSTDGELLLLYMFSGSPSLYNVHETFINKEDIL